MPTVTVSPKYQVVIPKEVRESMGIFSGQKIQVLTYQNRIELIPMVVSPENSRNSRRDKHAFRRRHVPLSSCPLETLPRPLRRKGYFYSISP
jgi:AbrB family looped-hinge helix DNA binding protein